MDSGNITADQLRAKGEELREASVVVSINSQITPEAGAQGVFEALRSVERRAVCAALADR